MIRRRDSYSHYSADARAKPDQEIAAIQAQMQSRFTIKTQLATQMLEQPPTRDPRAVHAHKHQAESATDDTTRHDTTARQAAKTRPTPWLTLYPNGEKFILPASIRGYLSKKEKKLEEERRKKDTFLQKKASGTFRACRIPLKSIVIHPSKPGRDVGWTRCHRRHCGSSPGCSHRLALASLRIFFGLPPLDAALAAALGVLAPSVPTLMRSSRRPRLATPSPLEDDAVNVPVLAGGE